MLLSEHKQRKIFDMLKAGDSVRKIAKAVHVAQSTVQAYKKIYYFITARKGFPPSSDKTGFSSRNQSIIALGYEFSADQPSENPRNDTPPTTDAITSNQQIALGLSGDLEQSEKKNKEIEQNLKQVTDERDNAKVQVQDLTQQVKQKDQEKEQLKQNNIHLTTTLDAVNLENQELKDTVNKQRDLMEKMKQNHQRKLEEQKKKANQEKLTMQKEHNNDLEKFKVDVTTMGTTIRDLTKKLHDVTNERDNYKSEVSRLTREHENDLIKYATVGLGGFGVGTAIGWWLRGENNNPAIPIQIEEGKNTVTRYEIIPILEEATIQPDNNHTTSGVPPEIQASPILYSGAVSQNNGVIYGTGYDVSSHQHYTVSHPGQPDIYHGGTGETTTSGSSWSGVCISTNATIRPLHEIPPIQYSSPPQMTPTYFFPLTPPDDPSNSFLMKQIKLTTGPQFEEYLKGFFIYQNYQVSQTKASHDQGADLIAERGGEKIVIQAKQWKEHVGTSAIQEAIAAKLFYKANDALAICTSEFTEEAKKLASKIGVECWDGKRLLQELYKHGYFSPPP